MAKSIFKQTKKEDFFAFLDLAQPYIAFDPEKLYQAAEEVIHATKKNLEVNPQNLLKQLEQQWYGSLKGNPDYSVYSHPVYLSELWACWILYSRKSLLDIQSLSSLGGRSVVQAIGKIKTIFDLGCGPGFTTAGLKELFPESNVFGTNLKESFQFKIAEDLGKTYGFCMREEADEPTDLIFASEYFEHLSRPVEDLYHLIMKVHPTYFVIANGFNGIAIGHFNTYQHQGKTYSNSEMSRLFNQALRMLGYEKIKTKIWNNRPSFWRRVK